MIIKGWEVFNAKGEAIVFGHTKAEALEKLKTIKNLRKGWKFWKHHGYRVERTDQS